MVNILEEACGSELEEVLVRPLAETCGFGRGVMASGLPLWGWMRWKTATKVTGTRHSPLKCPLRCQPP